MRGIRENYKKGRRRLSTANLLNKLRYKLIHCEANYFTSSLLVEFHHLLHGDCLALYEK